MSIPSKFFSHNFILSDKKELLLLKKKQYRVKSLSISLKGSSSLSEYSLDNILKTNKPSSDLFKSLQKIKTRHISDSLLRFLSKNKQVLKSVKSFTGSIGTLPSDKAPEFSRLINVMKYLNNIEDVGKFAVREVLKQRGYTFTHPKKLTSKPIGGKRAIAKGDHSLSLKRAYPLHNVKKIEFSPHLNMKRMFPCIQEITVDCMFLEKIQEIVPFHVKRLTITDEKTFGLCQKIPEDSFQNFQNLEAISLKLVDCESSDVLKLVSYLPKRPFRFYFDIPLEMMISNQETLDQFLEFLGTTGSRVDYRLNTWPDVKDYFQIFQAISEAGCHRAFAFSQIYFDTNYSQELQKSIADYVVNSQCDFDKVVLKITHGKEAETSFFAQAIVQKMADLSLLKNLEVLHDYNSAASLSINEILMEIGILSSVKSKVRSLEVKEDQEIYRGSSLE